VVIILLEEEPRISKEEKERMRNKVKKLKEKKRE